MNIRLLHKHIASYKDKIRKDPEAYAQDAAERERRREYYSTWTPDRIATMSPDDLYEYLADLWAMLLWGNKHYVVDKLIDTHGLESIRTELAHLVWAKEPIESRWDRFRSRIKGMGPAMMSEVLCYCHPYDFMIWNRRAYVGFDQLGIENLPRYKYQVTGKKYSDLSKLSKQIAEEINAAGLEDTSLLDVDYFIWHELQTQGNLSDIHKKKSPEDDSLPGETDPKASEFIHDEIRDKLAEIGTFLGLTTKTEVKVADGSKVDAVWEQTIGNMGRIIYVFEVQTKGSIDSLILNLLKSMNNAAVQGVVAVSDGPQLERIKKHAAGVAGLRENLKYWDYKQVLEVHEALEAVNESINSLGLVPKGF